MHTYCLAIIRLRFLDKRHAFNEPVMAKIVVKRRVCLHGAQTSPLTATETGLLQEFPFCGGKGILTRVYDSANRLDCEFAGTESILLDHDDLAI